MRTMDHGGSLRTILSRAKDVPSYVLWAPRAIIRQDGLKTSRITWWFSGLDGVAQETMVFTISLGKNLIHVGVWEWVDHQNFDFQRGNHDKPLDRLGHLKFSHYCWGIPSFHTPREIHISGWIKIFYIPLYCPVHAGAEVSNMGDDHDYKKSMAYRHVFEMQKPWAVDVVRCMTNEQMVVEIPMKWHERMNQWNVEPTNPWITSWSAINPTRSQFLLVKFIFSYSFQWFSDVFPLVFGDPKRCRKTPGLWPRQRFFPGLAAGGVLRAETAGTLWPGWVLFGGWPYYPAWLWLTFIGI